MLRCLSLDESQLLDVVGKLGCHEHQQGRTAAENSPVVSTCTVTAQHSHWTLLSQVGLWMAIVTNHQQHDSDALDCFSICCR